MRKSTLVVVTTLLILGMVWSQQANAYQEIEVKNGGTLTGKTLLTGPNPPPRIFHLVLYPNLDMCTEVPQDEETLTDDEMNRVMFDFLEGPNRGLRDVMITLEHVEAGKPFNKDPINIRAENCKFYPTVNPVRQGEGFTIDNIDAVMHNSQVYQAERGKIILNIPIPAEQVSDGHVTFQKDYKIFQMICGMHEFMQTWGFRIQNPYYYKTNKDGSFKIENIPPGEYVVNAWHFLMKLQQKKITIPPNGNVEVNFEFDGGQIERPLYETIKSGRIKKDARVPGSVH